MKLISLCVNTLRIVICDNKLHLRDKGTFKNNFKEFHRVKCICLIIEIRVTFRIMA